jgi:hypothetical protein
MKVKALLIFIYMYNIGSILGSYSLGDVKRGIIKTKPRQMNLFPKPNPYYQAKTFADKYNLSIPFVLKLFKKYSVAKVLALDSFLADYPLKSDVITGLIIWKLNKK